MEAAKIVFTLMLSTTKLSASDGIPLDDKLTYRSTVSPLQCLVHSRPDIVFPVDKLCQFLQNPTFTHWAAVKMILRYLKGTINYGLVSLPNHPWIYHLILMQILPCFLEEIWFHGLPRSSPLLQDPQLKQSFESLQMHLKKLCGSKTSRWNWFWMESEDSSIDR